MQQRNCLFFANKQAKNEVKRITNLFSSQSSDWIIPWMIRVFQTQIFSLDVPRGSAHCRGTTKRGAIYFLHSSLLVFHSVCVPVCFLTDKFVFHMCAFMSHRCKYVCRQLFTPVFVHCEMLMRSADCVTLKWCSHFSKMFWQRCWEGSVITVSQQMSL